jgi:hypothetical protein
MHFFCSPFVAIWRSGMIDRLFNLSHTKSCEILSAGCAFFPDASIDEQLGMIALPVGDRSVGNERAGFRSARAFEPIVGYSMPPATPDQPSDAQLSVEFLGSSALAKEPLFLTFAASVEFRIVMTPDDLQRAGPG